MKFPVTIEHRKIEAKIYGKTEGYPFYRVSAYVGGKRRVSSFASYTEAKTAAEKLVRDIASGSQAVALSNTQSREALDALQRLQSLYAETGIRVGLSEAVSRFAEAATKLKSPNLTDAIDGFIKTLATVKRVGLKEAVEQFMQGREHLTVSQNGKRPQISKPYNYTVGLWLMEFANTLPGTDVCDLTGNMLDAYISNHADVSPRTRNGRRMVVTMLLKWCARKNYLDRGHRLFEADRMATEDCATESIEFYKPEELSALLRTASAEIQHKHLAPVIALCGLAGLRLQEAVRLTWKDVFRINGHIEISQSVAKTQRRRLVEIVPSLAGWLRPYSTATGPVWNHCLDKFHTDFGALRTSLKISARRNGLRHAYCTFHFAAFSNENLTAAQAGNSPAMIHSNYKAFATKAEGLAWFAVAPEPAENRSIQMPVSA